MRERSLSCLFLLLLAGLCASSAEPEDDKDSFELPLYMPARGNRPPKYNDYRCRATKIASVDNYIASTPPSTAGDNTALLLHMTSRSQERVSGVYLIGSSSKIRAGKEQVIIDTACQFGGPKSIVPIAFRTHAHAHSKLIVGYVGDGEESWTEIGFRSPQDPQAFYPVINDSISVNPGDWLAARCVYNTSGTASAIHMGPDTEDEMCNFYIMFHTENDERPLTKDNCWHPAPSRSHFPPLPVLPPSQGAHPHHHHHSLMGDSMDEDIEIIQPTSPIPITSSNIEITSSPSPLFPEKNAENDKDEYVCPSPIPPGPVPPQCEKTTPTNQPTASDELLYSVTLASDWPFNGVDNPHVDVETGRGRALGQVTSVAMAPDGSVLVLHRGPRVWDARTFTSSNVFVDAAKGPIATPTLLKFSREGVLRGVWGGGLFYLPHSLTVDESGWIWITDVATHQVFKFSGLTAHEPSLTLGHKLTPGSVPGYFCKPSDVAVASSGDFYVADGYCNSRVVSYSPHGTLKAILGDFPIEGKTLFVPHSIALNPAQDELYVADRENQRIVVMDVAGAGKVRVLPARGLDRVFGVGFSGLGARGWPLLCLVQDEAGERGFGVAVGEDGELEMVWGVEEGMGRIHDLAVDLVHRAVYVTELTPARIWKYNIVVPGDTTTVSPTIHLTQPPTTAESNTPALSDTTETPPTTATPSNHPQTPFEDAPAENPPFLPSEDENMTRDHSDELDNTSGVSSTDSDSSSSSSSGGPAYSGDVDIVDAEVTMSDTASKHNDHHSHSDSAVEKKMKTPAFHYGLFAAIFAIVALILVVVVGILKEHRFLRFRGRRGARAAATETKSPRETLHSLLGPSKLGFSRLRTYDSDSEVEEFPIFSRQL